MGKFKPFRYWYYLRIGYQMYFAFIFASVNTLVITYFLAIEKAPFLEAIFPTFTFYAIFMIGIGIPILGFVGFLHFKKIPAFRSEQEISVESNPYIYKLPPGFQKHVTMPYNLLLSQIIIKIANNEKLTDAEINKMKEIQEKMNKLIQGGYVGTDANKLPFDRDMK